MGLMKTLQTNFTPFVDPATDLKIEVGRQGARLQFTRNGSEHDYYLNLDDESVTARHAKSRRFPSIRSLFASAEFADIKGFATTQARMFRAFEIDSLIPPEGDVDGARLSRTSFNKIVSPSKESNDRNHLKIDVVLIDGPAGVGKTSLIQALLVHRARRFGEPGSSPPVLHVASRGRRLTSLSDALAQSIQLVRAKFTFDQVPVLIRHNLLQIAIDGFDELVDPEGYRDAWFALRDFLEEINHGGPIILAGRDTFFDQQSFRKELEIGSVNLSHIRLQPSSTSTARSWLRQRGWSEADIKDPYTNIVLRPGSYALRPFFLSVLAKAKSWKNIETSDLTPRAFLVENFLQREAGLISENLPIKTTDAKASLTDLFEEIALEMATNENDTVDLGFLQLVTEVAFGRRLEGRELAKLQHKAGSFALLESDHREGHRKFPHTEISHHFLASALIENVLKGAQIPFLRRGVLAGDFLSIFAEQFQKLPIKDAEVFINRCDRSLIEEATFDRLSENLMALQLATLCHQGLHASRIYSDLAVGDAVIFGVASPARLIRVKCQRLDLKEAQLSAVDFEECEVSTATVDETTQFGSSLPRVHHLLLLTRDGTFEEVYDPVEIDLWMTKHSMSERTTVQNIEALQLFERVCRVMLRQHMIKEHPSDPAGRLLEGHFWKPIERILTKDKLLDRLENRGTSGAAASFLRLRDPFALLVHRDDNLKIKSIWTKIANIPNG